MLGQQWQQPAQVATARRNPSHGAYPAAPGGCVDIPIPHGPRAR